MTIAQELRDQIAQLRVKPIPLADLIPLLQRAADALDKVERAAAQAELAETMHQRNGYPRPATIRGVTGSGKSEYIYFKSGREYTEHGQRIGAQRLDTGGIIFTDIDRGIEGHLTPEFVAKYGLKLVAADIMWAYDNHEKSQYWTGLSSAPEDAVRKLREATRASLS